jgi:general stress protein 26
MENHKIIDIKNNQLITISYSSTNEKTFLECMNRIVKVYSDEIEKLA